MIISIIDNLLLMLSFGEVSLYNEGVLTTNADLIIVIVLAIIVYFIFNLIKGVL